MAASILRRRWQKGETPDLARALDDEPGLRKHRTLVIELAYEEYCYRLRAGESLTAEEFCQRFPWLERSLGMYILVQSLMGSEIPFLPELGPDLWPNAGEMFLGFNLLSELGRGTYGRVYEASERVLGDRRVVLKVAWQGGHEAAILGRLRHPNIVPIYSIKADAETGLTGFCMPLLSKVTLATAIDDLFAGNRLPCEASEILRAVRAANEGLDLPPPQELPHPIYRWGNYVEGAVHLGVQLAEALAHAHSRGIYHRDLKPSNILMSAEARPLLLDFNISIDETRPARACGTLPYMAPEELAVVGAGQSGDKGHHFDPRSDLFSLGVILYELLAGKLPFGPLPNGPLLGDTVGALKQRQAAGAPPLAEQNPQVGRRLAALVHRMLAVDPEDRLLNADQFADALRAELAFLPRLRRRLVRHRRKVFAGGAAAIVLIAVAGAYLALRPAYAVRQLRAGIVQYEAGDYDGAIEELTQSLKAAPYFKAAFLARAKAWKMRGDYQAAIKDIESVPDDRLSPLDFAAKGYCMSQLNWNESAVCAYQTCLEGERRSASVWNNLGYAHLRLAEFDAAETCFEQAAALDDTLMAPHLNLADLCVLRDREATVVPAKALEHAQRALEIGPESKELNRIVAALYATTARRDRQWTDPAIHCVARAMVCGATTGEFLADSTFAGLLDNPAFQEALKQPAEPAPSRAITLRILDPQP
jgi:tetratricopeptide (TPR) repeat protein